MGLVKSVAKNNVLPAVVAALEDLYVVRPLMAKLTMIPKPFRPLVEVGFAIAQALAVKKFAPRHSQMAASALQCLVGFAVRDAVASALNHPMAAVSDLADSYAGVLDAQMGSVGNVLDAPLGDPQDVEQAYNGLGSLVDADVGAEYSDDV